MIYGSWRVSRGHCCRCGDAGRPLYTLQVEPDRKPFLKLAQPGSPDNAACAECFEEVADTIIAKFQVPA